MQTEVTVTEPAAKTTRAQRMAMPLAPEVVKDLAVEHGACIRPIQLRRTNLDTGEVDRCSCRAGTPWRTFARPAPTGEDLRAAQCRESWHLEDEPDLLPTRPPKTSSGG